MKLREMGHRLEWPIEILSEIELRLGAWMKNTGCSSCASAWESCSFGSERSSSWG
jgi:hypothetical protein